MNLWRRFLSWGIDYRGSSRSTGLIRLGLPLLMWARFGTDMLPLRALETAQFNFRILFFISTFAMAVGFFTRWACAASAICVGVIYFFHPYAAHHTYLLMVATAFLMLTPAGKSYSVDRWLALKRAARENTPPPAEWGNLTGLRLITCQLLAIYFWGACSKMTPSFFNGERIQGYLAEFYGGIDFEAVPGFEWLCALAGSGLVIFEGALVVGLVEPRLRRFFIPAGIAFHLLIYVLVPVHTFSATMILLYLALIPADDVHRWLDWMQGYARAPGNPSDALASDHPASGGQDRMRSLSGS